MIINVVGIQTGVSKKSGQPYTWLYYTEEMRGTNGQGVKADSLFLNYALPVSGEFAFKINEQADVCYGKNNYIEYIIQGDNKYESQGFSHLS